MGRDGLAEEMKDCLGDAQLTRRDALKRLGLLGFSATVASTLLAESASGHRNDAKAARAIARPTDFNAISTEVGSRTPPRLPRDIVKGQSAWRMIGWGGYGHVYSSAADYRRWRRWGFGGHATGIGGSKFLYGFGGSNDFVAGSAAQAVGSRYDWQKALEGLPVQAINGGKKGLGLFQAAPALGLESYLGFYCFQSTPSSAGLDAEGEQTHPPFGDWWDDARWTSLCAAVGRVAGAAHYLGATGITMDAEADAAGNTWYAKPSAGHRHADLLAKIEERGYQFGRAIFANFPDPIILVYSWYLRAGIYGPIHGQLVDDDDDARPDEQDQFFFGILRAMKDARSSGRIVNLDASFYHGAASAGQVSGMSLDSCLRWHGNNAMAVLTRMLPAATRDYVIPRFDTTPFSWAGTDGTSFYKKTQQGEPSYTEMLETYRRWGMLSRRAEYLKASGDPDDGTPASVAGLGAYAGHNNYSFPSRRLEGMARAAARTSLRTEVPTFRSPPSAVVSRETVTIRCEVEHHFGVRRVEVYRGAAFDEKNTTTAYLGTMRMIWDRNGGTYGSGFPDAFMSCRCETPGTEDDWFVLKAVSLKEDVAWSRVRANLER